MTNSILIIALVSVVFFVLSIFLFIRIVLYTVHCNLFSEYLEISPFFTLSIVIFVHLYTKEYSFIFLTIAIVHILLLLLLFISHQYLARGSFRFFNAIKKDDDVPENNPQMTYILPGNIVSVLRQITLHTGDPTIFIKILKQRQYNVKASPMLEIIRFLSLFPSKRVDMITELSHIKSASNYNRFIIYFFLKTLKSLTSVSEEKHTICLDELQRSFLVHNHVYWKFREKKKYFKSFKEACATAYYFIETKLELMGLIERFPFDSYLYTRYADFALIGCGDFEQYQRSMTISSDLEKDNNLITDPILHRIIKNNVRVIQFCNTEEMIGSMPVRNSYSSSENEIPVASYVKRSQRMIPFIPYFHVIFSIAVLLIYFILSIPFESYSQKEYKNINNESPILNFLFLKSSSLMLFPFSYNEYELDNFSLVENSTICQTMVQEISHRISSFFIGIPQIQVLYEYSFVFFQDYFLENMKSNKSICQCLSNLTSASYSMMDVYINELNNLFITIAHQMSNIDNRIIDEKNDFKKEIILTAGIICIVIIYIIILIVQVNWVFRKNANVMKFLASKKRITSLLLEQCVKSWDNLYNYIQSKKLYLLHLHSENPEDQKITNLVALSRFDLFSSSMDSMSNIDYSSFYDESSSAAYYVSNSDISESTTISGAESKSYSVSSVSNKNDISSSKPMNLNDEYSSGKVKNINVLNKQINSESDEKNIEQSFTENAEIDEDPIKITIEATMHQKPLAWLTIPFCIFLPNLIAILVILLFMVPYKLRMDLESDLIDDYLYSCNQLNATFDLIENTYFILRGSVNYSSSFYIKIQDFLHQKETNITSIFTRNQCLQLQEVVCFSFSALVNEISTSPPSYEDLLFRYLPAFIDFGINAISVTFYSMINPYMEISTSSIVSFYVDFSLIGLLSIYFNFFLGTYLTSGFNSLYHFPETFLKKKEKKKIETNNPDFQRPNINSNYEIENSDDHILSLPSTIITVASVIATDEIYSISKNAAVLLNRPIISFIGEKFNDTFSPILNSDQSSDYTSTTSSNNNNNNISNAEYDESNLIVDYEVENTFVSYGQFQVKLREHVMPDHVKKKIFRCSSKKNGEFLITLLVEDEAQGIIKPAYKQESVSERLMNYIPTYFAKYFSDSFTSELSIESPLLVFLRYDTSKLTADLDKFFAAINTCVMNYSSFKIVKADGGVFLFASIKKVNKLISYLFMRDIISEGVSFSRVRPTGAPVAVYVESFESLDVEIKDVLEPCLEIGLDNVNEYEALLFRIGKNMIAFNSDIISNGVIDDIAMREQISIGGLSRSIKKLPFDKYVELFNKFL